MIFMPVSHYMYLRMLISTDTYVIGTPAPVPTFVIIILNEFINIISILISRKFGRYF